MATPPVEIPQAMNSEMEMDTVRWHWATEMTEPESGSERELMARLESGALPPFTVVWKKGWAEWLPAMQVARLSPALPDDLIHASKVAHAAAPDSERPAVPTSEFPRLRRLARESLRGTGTGGKSELAKAEALPTWATCDSNYPEQESITAKIPEVELRVATDSMRASELADTLVSGEVRSNQATGEPREFATRPLVVDPLEVASVANNTPKLSGLIPALSRHPALWAGGATALLAVAIFFATRLPDSGRSLSVGQEAGSVSPAASQSSPGSTGGNRDLPKRAVAEPAAAVVEAAPVLSPVCHPLGAPVKLDAWALADVPPLLRHIAGTSQVALGYAKSRERARGLLLDVGTLKFERVFNERRKANVYSVTPLPGEELPKFRVERRSSKMAYSVALETSPPMRLGMLDAHMVLGEFNRSAERLWPLPHGAIITLPSVARLNKGFAVATRVGRAKASVHSGIIGWTGQTLTEFPRLDIPRGDLGRPVIVAGETETVLAVTVRDKLQGDQLFLARSKNGTPPTDAKHLDILEAKVRLRAPVLAALPKGGGYVLGWTQGVGWRKRVRIVKLSSSLEPVGPPADITSVDPELNGAVSGSMYWLPPERPIAGDGQHVLLFHFLGREKGHSLWVSDIACEPAQIGI